MKYRLARFALSFLFLSCASGVFAADWRYAVRPGDTLVGIGEAYLRRPQDWPRLQSLNAVADPKRLMPGERLRIPVDMLRRGAAVATVIHVRGEVWRANGGERMQLAVGDTLKTGDVLVTAAASNASLRFVDGSRLLVSENGRITLDRLRQYGGTGMAETVIRLHAGEVANRVQPQRQPAARYRVETEALNLGVRGTDFRAGVAADGSAQGEVLEGRVLASGDAGGRPVALPAGFGTLARPGQPPSVPIALAPAPVLEALPARIEHLPLRFAWPAVQGAAGWHAQLYPADSDDVLLRDVRVEEPAVRWRDLPDGRYRLRVRVLADNGLEGLDGEHVFELAAQPEAPLAVFPQAGQTVRGNEIAFAWAQPLGVAGYRLQIADNPLFDPVGFDLSPLSEAGHRLSLPAGDYFWRLASIAGDGRQGPFGAPQSFSLRPLPEGPGVEAPRQEGGETRVRWRESEPGLVWRVQLARDAAFTDLLADERVSEPVFRLPHDGGGTCFLRVQAIDRDGVAGPFGQPQRIELPSGFPLWLLLFVPVLFVL